MIDPVTRGIFDGLVRRAGGVDAVAAVLGARYGVGYKGTVSKMCSGQIGVTIDAAIAVEDFVGARPLSNRMYERDHVGRSGGVEQCLRALAAQSAMASGQAHAAVFRAFSHQSDDPDQLTPQERAEVIAEMRTARQVLTDIINTAEASG